jgi:hypothetical protein
MPSVSADTPLLLAWLCGVGLAFEIFTLYDYHPNLFFGSQYYEYSSMSRSTCSLLGVARRLDLDQDVVAANSCGHAQHATASTSTSNLYTFSSALHMRTTASMFSLHTSTFAPRTVCADTIFTFLEETGFESSPLIVAAFDFLTVCSTLRNPQSTTSLTASIIVHCMREISQGDIDEVKDWFARTQMLIQECIDPIHVVLEARKPKPLPLYMMMWNAQGDQKRSWERSPLFETGILGNDSLVCGSDGWVSSLPMVLADAPIQSGPTVIFC